MNYKHYRILVLVFVVLFIGITIKSCVDISRDINKRGGLRGIVIEVGKEIKSISNEINN